ncbi:MAG: ATP-binding protein, partial [Nitrospiraceae bacterium]
TVHLRGQPVLINDISEVRGRIHPLHWELAARMGTESIMAVPLKVKGRILGALTVERIKKHMWTSDDLDLLVTFGNALAIALDNVEAYQEIEELNARLELKVRDRTAQLEDANEQLKELDRLKNQFLSHVSHDLRTPLTAIKGFTTNLLDGVYGSLTTKQVVNLERVNTNVERLTRMIASLLDLSRIVAGKLSLIRTNVSLQHLAHDVVEEFQLMALNKGLRLELFCPEEDLSVIADADRVIQILTNLIDNALKFTPHGGSIRILVERHGHEHAAIAVSDTGPGIPEDAISQLFDPFFQAHPGTAGGKSGLGLGLAIVKYLVDLHGGAVSVTSTLGKGASFQITLPLTKSESHEAT